MNTGTVMALGILLGVMIAGLLLARKARHGEGEYDEMQLRIRAKGYQIGFFTALALLLALILLAETGMPLPLTFGFAAFAALILSVTVFAVWCVLHDAFIAFGENVKQYFVIFGVVVLLEGLVALRYLTNGTMLEDGKLGFSGGAPAVMCLCFLAILITLIVRTIRSGKEAEE